jgi:hypothetical protein
VSRGYGRDKSIVTSEAGENIRSLRRDGRLLRSQNIFLNFAGRSFGQLFDEGHTVRRLKVREVRARKLAQLVLIGALRVVKVRSNTFYLGFSRWRRQKEITNEELT